MQTSRHCGRRERETIGGKLPTVLYVRVSSSYHGKVVLKITAVLLKNSTALLIKQACLYEKQSKFSIPIRTLCGLCVSAIVVVCCRCVLHRLCSTTCMRPCIEPLGVLSRHPCRNPKPLPLGERQCMLGWFCIVQSLWAYTPGVRAGAECWAAALTKQGRLQSVAHSRCTMQRHQRLTTRMGLRPKQGCFGCLPKVLHDAKPTEQATLNPHFKKLYIFLTD